MIDNGETISHLWAVPDANRDFTLIYEREGNQDSS